MDELHTCGNCGEDFDILYGYKPYNMKSDQEYYCEDCFEIVHEFSFEDVPCES